MKKNFLLGSLVFILSLIVFSVPCKGQVYLGLGAGVSTKAPIAELQIGVENNYIQAQTGFLFHLSNKVNNGASFYGKVSGIIHLEDLKIAPGIGYAYNLKSNDRKELNSNSILFSIYGYKELGQGELFMGLTHTDKTLFATIGLRMLFE